MDDTFNAMNSAAKYFTGISTGVYVLKLQIMVADHGGAADNPRYDLDRRISLGSTSTYTSLTYRNGSLTTAGYDSNRAGSGRYQAGPEMMLNQWYEITQVVNLDDNTWSWTLENLTDGEISYSSGEFGVYHLDKVLDRLAFSRTDHLVGGGKGGLIYVDNITLRAIPEPGLTGMMLSACFAGFVWLIVFGRAGKDDRKKAPRIWRPM